jgi:hypothetical protein
MKRNIIIIIFMNFNKLTLTTRWQGESSSHKGHKNENLNSDHFFFWIYKKIETYFGLLFSTQDAAYCDHFGTKRDW